MVSLPAWLKCRCFRPSLPGDDDTPAPKKMSSSAADAQVWPCLLLSADVYDLVT